VTPTLLGHGGVDNVIVFRGWKVKYFLFKQTNRLVDLSLDEAKLKGIFFNHDD